MNRERFMPHVVNIEDSAGSQRIYSVNIIAMDTNELRVEFRGQEMRFDMKKVIEIVPVESSDSNFAYRKYALDRKFH